MGKLLVAVNAGPRVGWNTDTLINEAIKGAESQGATVQKYDLSKTDWQWTLFNPEAKQKRHEEVFPQECRKAFELGAALALK